MISLNFGYQDGKYHGLVTTVRSDLDDELKFVSGIAWQLLASLTFVTILTAFNVHIDEIRDL